MLGRRYLSHLKRLLRRFQAIRLGVGMGAAAVMTLAAGAAFWLINQGRFGLATANILLPALYLGLTQGKALSMSWGALVECLGYAWSPTTQVSFRCWRVRLGEATRWQIWKGRTRAARGRAPGQMATGAPLDGPPLSMAPPLRPNDGIVAPVTSSART